MSALDSPLPGRRAHMRFAADLSYGRHYGPAAWNARAAAVMILLYPTQGRWYLPLTVRPINMEEHAGQISLPGGSTENNESSSQTALRELHEELAVSPDGVELLGKLSPIYLFVSNYQVQPWVGFVPGRPLFAPHKAEVAELLEVPIDVLADPRNHGRHTLRRGNYEFSAPDIQFRQHRIWGATAMMLGELISLWPA